METDVSMRKTLNALGISLTPVTACRTVNRPRWNSHRRYLKTTQTSSRCWRKEKTNKTSKFTNKQKTMTTMELKSTCNKTTEN